MRLVYYSQTDGVKFIQHGQRFWLIIIFIAAFFFGVTWALSPERFHAEYALTGVLTGILIFTGLSILAKGQHIWVGNMLVTYSQLFTLLVVLPAAFPKEWANIFSWLLLTLCPAYMVFGLLLRITRPWIQK